MQQGRDESIHDYFSRMDKLVNKMKSNSDEIKEKMLWKNHVESFYSI